MAHQHPRQWSVEIETQGRGGTIWYHEAGQRIPFYWEFGGGDVVAIIDGPNPGHWDAAYPWAAGRGTEILERVAAEAIRQKASSCRADLDPHSGTILLRP